MTRPPAATEPQAPFAVDATAALDAAPAMIRDLDGTIRFWSAGAERLYGWPRQEALGARADDLLETRFPGPRRSIEATLLADGAWHGELTQTARDRRTLVVASHRALQRGAAGAPDRVVEINHEIGVRQEDDILAMRRLAAIIDSSSDAIIGKDLNGIITDWNPAAEALFGYRADEIIGRPVVLLFPPDREAEEAVILEQIRRGEQIAHYETVRRRKDGSSFPVSLTVSPIRDETGTIVGASKILRDLTEHHERERRLREAQLELFHTQRLTELGQLVSALVHELNQPLAAIGNYAAAGRRLLAPEQEAACGTAFQRIAEQTDRAHQIIRRLRNFVRKSDHEQRSENLQAMIREAVALASVSLKKEPVAIDLRLDPHAAVVTADRVHIQQVLFNLLRNAMEAMEQSARRAIVITTRPVEDGMVEIAVADTGSGLSPAVRPSLFRPFVTTKDNGMGVGLSICRSIVEAHGGCLCAEDNPGGGTVFRFTLPLAAPAAVVER